VGTNLRQLREGWAYDEIAAAERLTAERVRQIVAQVLRKRPVDNRSDHMKVQLARLAPALRLAREAIARGEIKAIAPYLKALDQIARCHESADASPQEGEMAREMNLGKIDDILAGVRREEDAMRAALSKTWAAQNRPVAEGGKKGFGIVVTH
jgi:hypothetical protein